MPGFRAIALRPAIALLFFVVLGLTDRGARAQGPPCPCSIWTPADVPAIPAVTDNQPIEIGLKFRSDADGFISAIRFYKGVENTGLHVAHLWSSGGALLGSATFESETGSGWQQVSLSPPVAITAATTYIASYHSASGYFAFTQNAFAAAGVDTPPLHALQSGVDGGNGVFVYGASAFPANGTTHNYWVDVVFQTDIGPDITPPTATATAPVDGALDVPLAADVTATFSESISAASLGNGNFELHSGGVPVSADITYDAANRRAVLNPSGGLAPETLYVATLRGGPSGIADPAGNVLETDVIWSFTTAAAPAPPPDEGPGGPILIVASTANPFGRYYGEILRAEGLNAFTVTDITLVTPARLAAAAVVVLGEMALTPAQAALFTDYVTGGGQLIAMRPDSQLHALAGLAAAGNPLPNAYLRVDTTLAPGAGITGETMQFHGSAAIYTVAEPETTRAVASLYFDAITPSDNPAVSRRTVGGNGGRAAAFAYDLARSIVYTRQGNPAWSGLERDGIAPIRSDDLFFGGGEADWVNLDKVAIPQADEQQRLLANLILDMAASRMPLPRFWYFPRGLKAAVVMTGDDHASGGTTGRFEQYRALSPAGCSVTDWECVRGTSYIFNGTPGMDDASAVAFTNDGFEIGLHVNTGCDNWTPASLAGFYGSQLAAFAAERPSVPAPTTNRTHCIVWSDYTTQAQVSLANGIRFDTNYYYFPGSWIQDHPGFMTGSGMPMRFAGADGTTIDVYQAPTQMTDESGQSYPFTVDTLLDRALGPLGYYGAFVANMHTDAPTIPQSDAIVASALARGVPVVTSRQMLEWVDGRNGSSFQSIAWAPGALTFTVAAAAGANGLTAMIPTGSPVGPLAGVTRDGAPVTVAVETIKGVQYAFFTALAGEYVATYAVDATPPVISGVTAVPGLAGTATISWTTDEPSDSRVDYGTAPEALTGSSSSGALVTPHQIQLSGLSPLTRYYYRVRSADAVGNAGTSPAPPAHFDMPAEIHQLIDTTSGDFAAGSGDPGIAFTARGGGEVTLAAAAAAEFDGAAVPADWTTVAWNAGGSVTVAGGLMAIDGARAGTTADFAPGRSVEFVATFSGAPFQHMGFAVSYESTPWAMFSTFGGGALFARTHNGASSIDTPLGSQWLGVPHRYRVDWTATDVTFSIDGAVVATHAIAIAVDLRPIGSDFNIGGGALTLDWVTMTPYAATGTFTSRVFDAGEAVDWTSVAAAGQQPAGTSLLLSVRTGDTPAPDEAWTAFGAPAAPPLAVGMRSRYLQYQALLATTDAAAAPIVEQVTAEYSPVPPNTPPTAVNDAYAVDQGATLTAGAPGVLGNDTDAESQTLTAALVADVSHGTLALAADGSFVYTPAAGYSGPDAFTYRASDGIDPSNTATVSITVNATGTTPVAAPDAYSVNEDVQLNVVAPGVLANDTDPLGRPLTAVLVQGPAHGTLTLFASGRVRYKGALNFNGADSFIYKAKAGASDFSADTVVTITVNAVNDAPIAGADSYSVDEGQTLNVPAPGILANDSDPEGGALTIILVRNVWHGSLTLNPDGSFTYTPNTTYHGEDSFEYRVKDPQGKKSAIVTATFTGDYTNDPPTAAPDTYHVNSGELLDVDQPGVLANDEDHEGEPLTAVLVSGPTSGTLEVFDGNGHFHYRSAPGFTGVVTFTYYALDTGAATSPTVTVTIHVH